MSDQEVYVLRWRYYDGSGGAAVRVYESTADAEKERDFLKEATDSKEWHVDHVPFLRAQP